MHKSWRKSIFILFTDGVQKGTLPYFWEDFKKKDIYGIDLHDQKKMCFSSYFDSVVADHVL